METFIRSIPIFSSLSPDEARLLASSLRLSALPAGTVLFNEGEPGENFSIVAEGQVEIIKAAGGAGEERVLNVLGPGDFLGELSLLSPGSPRSAAARARTPVRILEMAPADFERLIHGNAALAVAMLAEMSRRLRRSDSAAIRDLQEKNRQLAQALDDLRAAQEQLIEKERLEQELQMARAIQEGILPKELPAFPGWQVSIFWQPAHVIGGDFYDFIPLKDGRLGLVIGDVSGKGMPAALVMAVTRTLLRFAALSAAGLEDGRPGQALSAVNEICFAEIPANMFITCLFAVADMHTGRVRFANAGHTLPLQCSSRGVVELRAAGMPLGLLPDRVYDEHETTLAPGDCLFLCTDGLIEAHNPQREMYGAHRLQAHLAADRCRPGRIDTLVSRLSEFTGPGEQEDDITCVILERVA
jgi:serine phosphatase RsbU (regulator of sigma subunit)